MAKSETRYIIPHTISHIAQKVRSKKKTGRAFLPFLLLEPVVGFEPTTYCLQVSCRAVHQNPQASFGFLMQSYFL